MIMCYSDVWCCWGTVKYGTVGVQSRMGQSNYVMRTGQSDHMTNYVQDSLTT